MALFAKCEGNEVLSEICEAAPLNERAQCLVACNLCCHLEHDFDLASQRERC